jgi:hypothetical protein
LVLNGNSTSLKRELVRTIFISILKTLNALHHEEELCLLNLSLSKVLINKEGKPVLHDFSKAQSLKEPLKAKKLLTSLDGNDQNRIYLAPEIVNP